MQKMVPENITPIENRELTGITVKAALWLLGGLCSILIAVIMTYASIMNKLDRNQDSITEIKRGKELTDVQLKTVEVQLQTIEIRLVRLEANYKVQSN